MTDAWTSISRSTRSVRRAVLLSALAVTGAAVLGLSAVAFACTALAGLSLSTSSGLPGSSVHATGEGFAAGAPVTLTMRSASGAVGGVVLARGVPDAAGRFATDFRVPAVAPGDEVIVATQVGADGATLAKTASRARFQVLGAAPAPSAPTPPSAPRSLVLPISVIGVLLLGLGLAVVASRRRGDSETPAADEFLDVPLGAEHDATPIVEAADARAASEQPVGAAR